MIIFARCESLRTSRMDGRESVLCAARPSWTWRRSMQRCLLPWGGLLALPTGPERLARVEAIDAPGVHVGEVAMFAPVITEPRAIWCAALTFESHVGGGARTPAADYPVFFLRVPESQTGHRLPLVRPAVSDQLDYEGELAVVVGRQARHVALDRALSYVAGYSCTTTVGPRLAAPHQPDHRGQELRRDGRLRPLAREPR